MKKIIHLMVIDFKLIFRDYSLRTFLLMPFLIVLIINVGLPALVEKFPVVEDYTSYILMASTLQAPTMFGFIYCMVFIEEKDQDIARVYGVLPVSKKGFVLVRMIPSVIVSTAFAAIILIFQPFYTLSIYSILTISLLSALFAPMMALLVTVFSTNKMEGLTWFKIMNALLNIPILVFFVPLWKHTFGFIPSHWIFQSLDQIFNGSSGSLLAVIGFIYCIVIIVLLDIRFSKVHFA